MSDSRRYRSADGAARALAALLRDDAKARVLAEPPREEERARLVRVAGLSSPARGRRAWPLLAVAAAVALALGGTSWWQAHRGLTFSVAGRSASLGATVSASDEHEVALRFSDGSSLDVARGGRVRVDAASPDGAVLSLMAGTAKVHVVHRPRASWALDAGPFRIHVIGTRFAATWDDARHRLGLELFDGMVEVTGGTLSTPLFVRAGQRLEAGVRAGDWLLTSLDRPPLSRDESPPSAASASSSAPPAAASSAPASAPSARSVAAPELGASAAPGGRMNKDWNALLERADFDGIVRQAEALGVERCFAACSSGDLRILADAARYSHRLALAEQSLLALRRRTAADASTAAFLLARLEEGRGNVTKALDWYARYLAEAPNGAYAADALAGRMNGLYRTRGARAAEDSAERYLGRFPHGVQAAQAERILDEAGRE